MKSQSSSPTTSKAAQPSPTIIPYWFVMRAAGHLTPQQYNLADVQMGVPPHEQAANARLIAAAPLLLEALKALCAYDTNGDYSRADAAERYDKIKEQAEAALAAAEGKE